MRKITLFLVVAGLFGWQAEWNHIKDNLLDNEVEGKAIYVLEKSLPKGEGISSWRSSYKVPFDSYIFFIDDYPDANWEHPARLVFARGNRLEVIEVLAPPNILHEMIELTTRPDQPKALRTVNTAFRPKGTQDIDNAWAVLISGGGSVGSNYPRYYNDTRFIYETLLSYGYDEDKIYILFADGTDPAIDQSGGVNSDPDLDGDGDWDIGYSCTISNLDLVFDELADMLGPFDQLFIYSTDHGGGGGAGDDDVYLVGWGENIDDSVFAGMLSDIECGRMVITMEQCFSGGFIDDLAANNRIIATACRFDQVSWGGVTDSRYDEFVYHWTCAVNGGTPEGVAVDSDGDGDGLVSMEEAFLYAETHDLADEEPQYSSMPDFLGSCTFLYGLLTDAPFLVTSGYTSGDLTGDMDDNLDPGESSWLFPRLMNYGSDASSLTLSLHSEELSIIDSIIVVTSILNLDSLHTTGDTWGVVLPEDARVGDSYDLSFLVWDSTGAAIDTFAFELTIPKPELRLTSMSFRDEFGGEFIDPGEIGDLGLTIENVSLQEGIEISLNLSSPASDVILYDDHIEIEELSGMSIEIPMETFRLGLSESAEAFSIVPMKMVITTSRGYVDTVDWSMQASGEYVHPHTMNEDYWLATGDWRIVDYRSISGLGAWYAGAELEHRYTDGMHATLTTAYKVALPPQPVLIYSEFLAMEPGYDQVFVEYSIDGDTWEELLSREIYMPPWRSRVVDLSVIPASAAYFRFRQVTDSYVRTEGWYIDQISILSDPNKGLFGGHHVQRAVKAGDEVEFRVTWYSSDGQDPELPILYIDDIAYAMEYVTGHNNSGAIYSANVAISDSVNYYFDFDGLTTELLSGPSVNSPIWSLDFSDDNHGLLHGGDLDQWEWGFTEDFGNVWGTDLDGEYDPAMSSYLRIPLPDLSEMENPVLYLRHWYSLNDIPSNVALYGAGNVKIKGSGGWTILMPERGYDCVASISNLRIPAEDGFGGDSRAFWQTDYFPISSEGDSIRLDVGGRESSDGDLGWYISEIGIISSGESNIAEGSLPPKLVLEAYPNPFNSRLNISTPGYGRLSIFDLKGRMVFSRGIDGHILWDAQGLSSGIYLLRFTDENGALERRVLLIQ